LFIDHGKQTPSKSSFEKIFWKHTVYVYINIKGKHTGVSKHTYTTVKPLLNYVLRRSDFTET